MWRDATICIAIRRAAFSSARAGDIDICTSTEVLQEILYRYAALKRLDLAAAVYDLFVQLCPTVLPITLADTDRAKTLMTGIALVGARDAIHAAVMSTAPSPTRSTSGAS